jgi:hypothetical protein
LLASVNQSKKLPDGITKAEARLELARALDGAQRALAPATPEELGTCLVALAEIFKDPLPQGVGLDLYIGAIKHISSPAAQRAVQVLVRNHKYPRLPLPAEFIDAAETGTLILRTHLTRVERAMTTLEALP